MTEDNKIKCESCGNNITSVERYTVSEIWESEHGDTMREKNIRAICPKCNFDNYIFSEWE